ARHHCQTVDIGRCSNVGIALGTRIGALDQRHPQLDLENGDHADVEVSRRVTLCPGPYVRVHHIGTLSQLADNVGIEEETHGSAACGSDVNRGGSNSTSLSVCSQSTMLRLSVSAS